MRTWALKSTKPRRRTFKLRSRADRYWRIIDPAGYIRSGLERGRRKQPWPAYKEHRLYRALAAEDAIFICKSPQFHYKMCTRRRL